MKQQEPKPPPGDDASFERWVRSRNRRIARLVAHLKQPERSHDLRNRSLLQALIDERGAALQGPPEGISSALVEQLRQEVRRGQEG